MDKYFIYDSDGNGFETFRTEAENQAQTLTQTMSF